MKIFYKITVLTVFFVFIMTRQSQAQYAAKKVRSKHEVYTDSLKNVNYTFVFPIWGQGAYKKGFDIPYPIGIMANYMWLDQGILIDNLQLGFKSDSKDIPLTPVDFIGFGDNTNTSYTVNVRPDIWIFPFLDLYGIFGYGQSHTVVNINRLGEQEFELESVVDQGISTAGVGLLTAFGIGPVWLSVDANLTWNKPELLDKAVMVSVVGIRLGHTFTFKNRPDRNIAVWVGAMRASMASTTVGEVKMIEALPPETWERRDEIVNDYWAWYNNLDPTKPLDKIKLEKADEILTPIIDKLESKDGSSIVRYGLDKQVQQKWNGIVGMQFQLNKHWMFRTEAGLIGNRKSVLTSLNYRFLM
ncbi:MAG: hypothetical protein L3J66_09465 [Bacteroidales bacterium]|nr:hypothetical protein [Bacteroidales bacterium]